MPNGLPDQPQDGIGGQDSFSGPRLFPDLPPELVPRNPQSGEILTHSVLDYIHSTRLELPLNDEETGRAEEAVAFLRGKINKIMGEFTRGQINLEQYQALFIRYGEQVALLAQIMQQEVSPSPRRQPALANPTTGLLREHHAARALGCLITDNLMGAVIHTIGQFDLPPGLLTPLLDDLRDTENRPARAARRLTQVEGGRWLCIVPGTLAMTVVLYSREPSDEQTRKVVEAHNEFEQANHRALIGELVGTRFVYPQQDLLGA